MGNEASDTSAPHQASGRRAAVEKMEVCFVIPFVLLCNVGEISEVNTFYRLLSQFWLHFTIRRTTP